METDLNTSSSDNCCLICASSSVYSEDQDCNEDDEDTEKIFGTFINCLDLTENCSDLSLNVDIQFCFKCKLKLEELAYIQSQIDKLLLRSKELKASIIADAVQQSTVGGKNYLESRIRKLIRHSKNFQLFPFINPEYQHVIFISVFVEFHPQVVLEKCDAVREETIETRSRKSPPSKTRNVSAKRTSAVSFHTKQFPQSESTDLMTEINPSALLRIKFGK